MPNALDEINEGLFFENEVGMLRLQEPSSLHDVVVVCIASVRKRNYKFTIFLQQIISDRLLMVDIVRGKKVNLMLSSNLL